MKTFNTKVVRVAIFPPHLADFKEDFNKEVCDIDNCEIKQSSVVNGWSVPKNIMSFTKMYSALQASTKFRVVAKSSTPEYSTMTVIHNNNYFIFDSFEMSISIYSNTGV